MRVIACTLKIEVIDNAGAFDASRRGRIWAFWHQQMFLIPWLHHQWFSHIPGAILTSPSQDGQIIADICSAFNQEAVRGSTSKQGVGALIALTEKVKEGYDIGITPDGPRGPAFQLQAGLLKLAQLSGGEIMPVKIKYSRCMTFPTWDHFQIPLPWSCVTLIFLPVINMPRRATNEEFEQMRLRIENLLNE